MSGEQQTDVALQELSEYDGVSESTPTKPTARVGGPTVIGREMRLTEVETRVLGCLVEKQRTTPDSYPLSLNSLCLACNQATNRDPVVNWDEAAVREALGSLGQRGLIRSGTGHGGRALKYRHLLEEQLPLSEGELSLLAVLMLRGVQTPGELKQRVERLYRFEGLEAVGAALEQLIDRGVVARLPRRPGQKEERYQQLLTVEGGPEPPAADPASESQPGSALEEQVDELRRRVEALEQTVKRLADSQAVAVGDE